MNKPWLDHYDAGVPRSIGTYPDKTLVDFVADHSHQRGDATALMFVYIVLPVAIKIIAALLLWFIRIEAERGSVRQELTGRA